jgi:hypothetical protein
MKERRKNIFNELEYRQTKRDCHCKCCDKYIDRDTEKVIYFRTFRGHGDPTHICLDCIEKINQLIETDEI